VPQNGFDVTNRAAIEEQGGCCRVSQDVRSDFLLDARELSVPFKVPPEITSPQAIPAVLTHKQCRAIISSAFEVTSYPNQRPLRKEHSPLFVAFADDPSLAPFKVDAIAIE